MLIASSRVNPRDYFFSFLNLKTYTIVNIHELLTARKKRPISNTEILSGIKVILKYFKTERFSKFVPQNYRNIIHSTTNNG